MKSSSTQRLAQLWELVSRDPDCLLCQKELEEARERLERRTDGLRKEAHDAYWELPTCIHTFFSRILEIAAEEMRFPEGE